MNLIRAEHQLNSLVEQRAKVNAEDVTAKLAQHKRIEQRREENRTLWIQFHLDQAERYRQAAREAEQRAANLIAGGV